ncbi:ammonium transporter [Methanoculleus sp. Wushi-C6]|uniref:Ammonium transporter n=1 Tax=Methanoculleus caldifontis TaxID=2651577 RepID=A0ABU3X1R7_9EURY|nr:ammonium transporter [Methanoculleus sp. Wushi-C6]MDV2481715.1 ammonium transporter [Methanoculleus sp. Wushi-C6]
MVSLKHVHIILIVVLLAMLVTPALAQDPTGAATLEDDPDAPVNFAWTLICGFLVMFMQAGFAMVETGLTRAKNAANILMKNLADFSFGALSYWAVGFALMFGTASGITGLLFGTDGFFLLGDAYDVSTIELWFFQMVFAATAATIVSGAVAERAKFSTYLIASVAITALIYPIYGHWLWGGGWLNAADFMVDLGGGYGALDFAGSGVVHAVGGFVGLAGALLLGSRLGKFRKDGTPVAIPGHALPLAVLGVFILWFGWFGFNPGSTLAATELRISVIAANTVLASAAGAVTTMFITWWRFGKPDVSMTGNGVLGGLVAITASCAWVSPWAAVVIGIVAGIVIYVGVWLLDWVLHIDDPVGAVSVHGFNGAWGLLALGIFADGTYGVYTTEGPMVTGLLYGNAGFLAVQAISMVVNFAWAFGLGLILFAALKYTVGIRVSPAEEMQGLDIGEHGVSAYPNFVIAEPPLDGEKA